jgi:branched-chain amino acid transport system permease protein
MDAAFILQLLLNGLVMGLIYGLVATGLSLLFGILHIVNFAHGEFLMVSMYAIAVLLPLAGGSFVLAIAALLLLAVVSGWLAATSFFAALTRLGDHRAVFEKSLLVTLGLSIILLNGTQYFFTATPRMVATDLGVGAFVIGPIRLTHGHASAAVVSCLTFAALGLFLTRTDAGRGLRAVAQNREAALMIGLDPERAARRAIIISVVRCAIAGAVLVPLFVFQPMIGQTILLKSFAIIIIGGMGNVGGAGLAGLGLGVLESLVGGYTTVVWQNAVAFIAMILVLCLRPQGLFTMEVRKGRPELPTGHLSGASRLSLPSWRR